MPNGGRTRRFSESDALRLLRFARAVPISGSFAERFEALTRELRRLVPFKSVAAFAFDPSTLAPPPPGRSYETGVPPGANADYAAYYMRWDPTWKSWGLSSLDAPITARPPPAAVIFSDYVPGRRFGKDPYTGEFLPRMRVRWIASLAAALPSGQQLLFGVHRETRQGDFTADERRLLTLVREDIARSATGALLSEALAGTLRSATTGDPTAGALLLAGDGTPLASDSGAASLAARLATPGCLADVLRQGALRVLEPPRKAAAMTLPLAHGGWLRVQLIPLGTDRVAAFLATIEPGSARFLHASLAAARLTERERAVATLAMRGLGNREIGHDLGIAGQTVKRHLDHVYRKLAVRGRTELAARLFGARDGLGPEPFGPGSPRLPGPG